MSSAARAAKPLCGPREVSRLPLQVERKRRAGPVTMWMQLMWGSLYLSACLLLQISALVWCGAALSRLIGRFSKPLRTWQRGLALVVAIFVILANHTGQVWIWSIAFHRSDAISDLNTAVYFSMVTYTTVGYGDVVLGAGMRIFASLASVNGVFAFGISTAFLVNVMGRIFSNGNQANKTFS